MRGFSASDPLDVKYFLQVEDSFRGVYDILGWRETLLRWSATAKRWEFVELNNHGEWSILLVFKGKARMQNSKTYFSFFSRWYFTSGTCIDKDQSWRKMNLHKLAKKGEFCCNNGLCIDSENRRDNSIDGVDHSDEENCELD